MQLKNFFKNEIVLSPYLILSAKFSPINFIKFLLLYLTPLVFFFFQFHPNFVLDVLIVVYTPKIDLIEVKVN